VTYVPRTEIEQKLVDAATRPSLGPVIVQARRGAGKSSILRQVASRAAAAGRRPVTIDLERICTSAVDFARRFAASIDAALGASGSQAREIRRTLAAELERRKPDPALLLDQALAYAEAMPVDPPLTLLLDELGEMSRLSRHEGLRDAVAIVARRLATSGVSTVASVSPASRPGPLLEALRDACGGELQVLPLPPFDEREMATFLKGSPAAPAAPAANEDLEPWMRATAGHPLYAEILARRVASGAGLLEALRTEMSCPGGLLHQECRFDYHLLVERSRGHSVVRNILQILSREEGLNLSSIAHHLRIQLPTALDYLSWLLEVGLIRRDGAGYVLADPVLRLWVTLNGPEPADLLEQSVLLLESPRRVPLPPSRPRGPRPSRRRVVQHRRAPDSLIEID